MNFRELLDELNEMPDEDLDREFSLAIGSNPKSHFPILQPSCGIMRSERDGEYFIY